MLRLFAPSVVEKIRTRIPAGRHIWEVDVFSGANEGLVVAEIELENQDDRFEKPDWVGEEVTADKRYSNAWLSRHPFMEW